MENNPNAVSSLEVKEEKIIRKGDVIFSIILIAFSLVGCAANSDVAFVVYGLPSKIFYYWGLTVPIPALWALVLLLKSIYQRKVTLAGTLLPALFLLATAVLFIPFFISQIEAVKYTHLPSLVLFASAVIFSFHGIFKVSRRIGAVALVFFFLICAAAGYYAYNQNTLSQKELSMIKTYDAGNGNVLVGPNTQQTQDVFNALDKMKQQIANATSTDSCAGMPQGEFTCVTSLALRTKNPQICQYLGTPKSYNDAVMQDWCLYVYIQASKDTKACSFMAADESSDNNFYKNDVCWDEFHSSTSTAAVTTAAPTADPLVRISVDGSRDLAGIKQGDFITVAWSTSKAYTWQECDALGPALPIVGKPESWIDKPLPPNGSVRLYVDQAPLDGIGVICYTDKQKNLGGQDYISLKGQ